MDKGFFSIGQRFTPHNLEERLREMKRRAKNLRPWLKRAGLQLVQSAQKNFQQGGRPKWNGLKLATLIGRGNTAGGGGLSKPLRDTGVLMASIASAMKHPQGVWVLLKDSLAVGTNVPYAGYHQFGTRWISAREFLLAQPEDEKVMLKMLTEFMAEPVK